MNASVQIILSLLIGVAAATLLTTLQDGSPFDALTLAIACVATLAAMFVGRAGSGGATAHQAEAPAPRARRRDNSRGVDRAAASGGAAAGPRESGQVKWFNVSKGFGFIVKDDGDEIFVHFRSIRGADRRGLKDGQRVSFVVAESEKGPQAEDVTPE